MRLILLSTLFVIALLVAGCISPTGPQTSTPTGTAAPTTGIPGTIVTTIPTPTTTQAPSPSPAATAVVATPIPAYTTSGSTSGGASTLRVSVLDVGQGDAILVQTPAGRTMLVDAGDADAGPGVVAALRERDITVIDAVAASHAHADHIGGFQAVFARFPVGRFYDAGYPSTSATYERMLTTIDQQDIRYSTPTRGETIDLDPAVRVDVLGPDGRNEGEIHDNMLVLRLSYGRTSFLLAGDMSAGLEGELVASGATVRSTVLKVAHHGSRSSSTGAFLAAVQPEVAVISVGGDNPYGHPTGEVLLRLAAAGATVYETGQSGTVTISSDGTAITVTTERIAPAAPPLVIPTLATARPLTTAPAVVTASPVSISALNLRGETVTITNGGPSPQSLAGWKLTDEGANHVFTFAGTTLPAGGSVTVATGTATGDLKWKSDNVWNNDGDSAYLYNAQGSLVGTRKG